MTEAVCHQNPSVLIVDDNPLIVNVIRGLLEAQHYQVQVSGNGEEALQVLSKCPVDVIVCDVMMPCMDGYELHEHVRQKAELSHIPFIFLTALGDHNEVSRGLETGADDYIVKPFDPPALLAVIRGKVRRSKQLKKSNDDRFNAYRKKVVHTLSHEFRTPLVAISTGSELLLDARKPLDEDKKHNLLQAINRGGQRLERLVGDFMAMQQLEGGIAERQYGVRRRRASLAQVVEQSMLQIRVEAEASGFCVQVQTQGQVGDVWVYDAQLIDILRRLVGNAMKFSVQHRTIEVEVWQQGDEGIIQVNDRGVGIDPQRMRQALATFEQLDRDQYEQQGSGMGLAIAQRYAAIHGGRLEFAQRPGGGAQVSLVLPIAK